MVRSIITNIKKIICVFILIYTSPWFKFENIKNCFIHILSLNLESRK